MSLSVGEEQASKPARLPQSEARRSPSGPSPVEGHDDDARSHEPSAFFLQHANQSLSPVESSTKVSPQSRAVKASP